MRVPDEKAFIHKGKKIYSLEELAYEIKNMGMEDYRHYVGPMHNYFSDWIADVLKNRGLADMLRKSKSRKEALKLIKKELKNKKRLEKPGIQESLKKIARDESEIKHILWKHYHWDMAKEFMYGLAIGIVLGLILSKAFG